MIMDKMILVDLETQSFDVHSGIYEVACLVVENYQIVDRLYLGKKINGYKGEFRYGFGFHDISSDAESISVFSEFISNYQYPLVAHNCPFDRKFLVYYNWIDENYPAYCSMRAIRMADNKLKSYSLQNLLIQYGIQNEIEHTAMSDVKDLYQLLKIVRPDVWLPVGVALKNYNSKKIKARNLADIDLNIDTTRVLVGENVCFTGTSNYPRHTMQEIAIKNGAEISEGITSRTTLLVVGLNAGSKLDKAQKKGIQIISDEEFMTTLNLIDKRVESA